MSESMPAHFPQRRSWRPQQPRKRHAGKLRIFVSKECESSPYLRHGSVFDNQKAVTVRSAFLQNKEYMDAFYSSGYTVLEMEAGPFLGATYELVNPRRVPTDEVVHLSAHTPFDVGILHYASDTPYSRRQSLLSKSLSFFGVDATYACAIAIVRRILAQEVARVSGNALRESTF